mmetsp:Transcript_75017/g.243842  ORF Transcript_75017/g.243842 Transcript_75017/m.243842 type:complete len:253 (+) Transcript_75017:672-1430(+)
MAAAGEASASAASPAGSGDDTSCGGSGSSGEAVDGGEAVEAELEPEALSSAAGLDSHAFKKPAAADLTGGAGSSCTEADDGGDMDRDPDDEEEASGAASRSSGGLDSQDFQNPALLGVGVVSLLESQSRSFNRPRRSPMEKQPPSAMWATRSSLEISVCESSFLSAGSIARNTCKNLASNSEPCPSPAAARFCISPMRSSALDTLPEEGLDEEDEELPPEPQRGNVVRWAICSKRWTRSAEHLRWPNFNSRS